MRDKWQQRSPRERRLISLGGLVVGILIFYLLIWSPLESAVTQQHQLQQTTQQLYAWMQEKSVLIARLKQATGGVRGRPTSLLLVTERSLAQAKLASYIKKVEQPDQTSLALQLDAIPFDGFISWLQRLDSQYAISIKSVKVKRTAVTGVVDIELTLSTQSTQSTQS